MKNPLVAMLMGKLIAEQRGAPERDALRIGVVQSMIGLTPVGILVTQRMADDARPRVPTLPPTTVQPPPPPGPQPPVGTGGGEAAASADAGARQRSRTTAPA